MANEKIYTPKMVRKETHKLYHKLSGCKGRNKLEYRYLAKMRYMLFFLTNFTKCTKPFLDGWEMPDYRTVEEIEKRGGQA